MKLDRNSIIHTYQKPAIIIIVFAIAIRIIVTILYGQATIYPDSEGYIELAQRLLSFNLSGYEGQRSPGYPLLLASTNISIPVVIGVQFLISIINLIIIYCIINLLGVGKRFALILTLSIAFYIPSIFFELAILSETLTLLFVSITFYITLKLLIAEKKKASLYLLLALSCTFLVLIKPFYIFYAILLFLFFLFSDKKLFIPLPILILPLIAFLGWSTINKINTGHFTSTTFYGFNLAQNCVQFAENTSEEYSDIGNIYAEYRQANDTTDLEVAMTIWQAYPTLQEKTGLSFPDLSKKMYDYSITTIKMNPVAYAQQVLISWCDFWKTSLYWEYDNFAIKGANVILKYICYLERVILQMIKIIFILLAVSHLFGFIRRRHVTFQLIISVVILAASILQAMMTYGTNSRFSYPFEMMMVILVVSEIYRVFINKKKLKA